MIVLGISGGPPLDQEEQSDISPFMFHDAAAAIVEDGHVMAAAEEERFTRVKHTNRFPSHAIRYCLDAAGISASRIDRVAYYMSEAETNRLLWNIYSRSPGQKTYREVRDLLRRALLRDIGRDLASEIVFIDHQLAHAACGYHLSGIERCLVLSLDGVGDASSGVLVDAAPGRFETLERFTVAQSLGLYYLQVIRLLGHEQFDEYKVMGMAAYGEPGAHRALFRKFYRLDDGGRYEIDRTRIAPTLLPMIRPTRIRTRPGRLQLDLAAALQESIEQIALHVLSHWRRATGHEALCFAGGVALNSSLNGILLRSGLFRRLFVPPIPHDAGCAIGAAFHAESAQARPPRAPARRWFSAYRGRGLGEEAELVRRMRDWSPLISFTRQDDAARRAAALIAGGEILSWCRGPSEIGPRALGNRSILADPRHASNRRLVNRFIKEREDYRPLAPTVPVEAVSTYFEVPETLGDYSYMSFVLRVHPAVRSLLPAVTHADGTARLQVVSRESNESFWSLLQHFGQLTGVPIVLNTSFNGRDEPLVDTLDDAIAAFLTAPIRYLMVEDWLIRKGPTGPEGLLNLVLHIPDTMWLVRAAGGHRLVRSERPDRWASISAAVYRICSLADGRRDLKDLLSDPATILSHGPAPALQELASLWKHRFLRFLPRGGDDKVAPPRGTDG